MSFPEIVYALRWLVRDTFRQALSSRIFYVILGVSVLCTALCLSVHIEGGQPLRPPGEIELFGADDKPYTGISSEHGHLTLGFGSFRLLLFRDGAAAVHFLHVVLAKWVAGAVGLILALVWTAAFLPEFLQPHNAAVLLAKPVPRWTLLAGKYVGVVVFVAFQALLLVGGTWVALGLATGYWMPSYLLAVPILVVHFAVVYSFSAFLAVCTRSTVACVFGSILFWFVCYGMNYGRHAAVALPHLAPEAQTRGPVFQVILETGYWVLPKPADLVYLLDEALQAKDHFSPLPEMEKVKQTGAFAPELSLLASLAFAVGLLGVAGRQLGQVDY